MSAIGMRVGLPKRTFYSKNGIYYQESGEPAPALDGCDFGCCLFVPNKAECPTICGCEADFCVACCDVACHPCDMKKCCDICLPLCVAKFPCCLPFATCCCDCAHPRTGFETDAKLGKVIFFEGSFCCNKGGSACTYCGKFSGKDVILKNDGNFVAYTEDLKYSAGKAATQAPATQAME
jgi:hypothetical protein